MGKDPTFADPWFFTAEDDTTYVVKAATSKDRSAFNEVVFGSLARHLDLRSPEVVAILVPPDLIADDPQLTAAGYPPGVHVGIARLPNGSIDLRGDVLKHLAPNLHIENAEELPGTVVFSSWIEDWDHRSNDGNWMLEPTKDNTYRVWIIDFGHSLKGPGWTAGRLQELSDPRTVSMLGPHKIAIEACRDGSFQPAVKRIDAVTSDELLQLIATVPSDWEPAAAERPGVAKILVERRPGVDDLFKGKP